MIEVTSDFSELVNLPYEELKLIGTECSDGTRESFAQHRCYNDIGKRRLFQFDTEEEYYKWLDERSHHNK